VQPPATDRETGTVYIVDATTTVLGPTRELTRRDKRRALAVLAETFHQKFVAGFLQLVRERTAAR
jgi:hypothetical protein